MKKVIAILLTFMFIMNVSASGTDGIIITSNSYDINSNESIELIIKSSNTISVEEGDYILFSYDLFTIESFETTDDVTFENNKLTFNKDMTIESDIEIAKINFKSDKVETDRTATISYSYYRDGEVLFSESFDVDIDTEEYVPSETEEPEVIEEETNILPYILGGAITITAIGILIVVIKKVINK